jgi:hypothetical protein
VSSADLPASRSRGALDDATFLAARSEMLGAGVTVAPSEALWAESQRVGMALLRGGAGFPPSLYASGGTWDTASTEDAVSAWITDRLVERGQLRKITLQASHVIAFRRLLEGSLRQHLVDQRGPSQTRNLLRRVKVVLAADTRFECTHPGRRASARRYRLVGTANVFAGGDRALCSAAWAAGDFPAVTHRDDAQTLSPVLIEPDLGDFLAALLGVAGEMSVRDVIAAMSGRYGLDAPTFDADASIVPGDQDRPGVDLIRDELADGVLAQLTPRQLCVLRAHHEERQVREIAGLLGCSVGTVSAETAAIRRALGPLGAHAGPVLNEVLDRVFKQDI